MLFDQPAQRRPVDWLRMGALADLGELLRSPSNNRLAAAGATAIVLPKQNWPASSITSKSRLPGGTRAPLAKSQAVPPITQPPAAPALAINPAYSFSPICCQRTSWLSYRFFATRSGSTPASIAQFNRFSTTACDCATTPMRQPGSATSRTMARAAV